MDKKEERNITSLTTSFAIAFQVNGILLQALNEHYYTNTNLSIIKLLVNSIMIHVLLRFNGGFQLRMYRFSLYSLNAVFVS